MGLRSLAIVQILLTITFLPVTARAQQSPKPYTQDQVKAMVRDGLGNEVAAKAIAQQGLDFVPGEDFLNSLKAAGASVAFLQALRAAQHPSEPIQPQTANAPLDQFQFLALLASGVPDQRIIELVKQRGVSKALHRMVAVQDSPLIAWFSGLGASTELVSTLRLTNVFPEPEATVAESHKHVAMQELSQKLKENPNNHVARLALAIFSSDQTAIGLMRDAVSLEPTDPWSHYMLGEYVMAEDSDEAITEFRRALQLKPNYPGAHAGIGDVLWENQDRLGGISEYREEVRLNPKEFLANARLVHMLTTMGKWDEAISAADAGLHLDPDDPGIHYELGIALEKGRNDPQSALHEYRQAYELDPDTAAYQKAYQNLLKSQANVTTGGVIGGVLSPVRPPEPPAAPNQDQARQNPKDGLKYVWIPPGKFMMGCSPEDDACNTNEKPAHQVTISKGFWIGQTPVTVGPYKRYVAATGRSLPPEPSLLGRALNSGWGDDTMPIVEVTWDEAQAYCGWAGGRLPTEAEWEYAARGGTTETHYGALDQVAWYADNSGIQRLDSDRLWNEQGKKNLVIYLQQLKDNGNGIKEVGLKQPNQFGMLDVLGDVQEWVDDWFDQGYYHNSPPADPLGPPSGQLRVMRGFSWADIASSGRVSHRYGVDPNIKLFFYGFRCAGQEIIPALGSPLSVGAVADQPLVLAAQVATAKLIFQPQPTYPPVARNARIQGVVRLNGLIGKDGSIEQLKVISGHPLLIGAALDAVSKWRYQPTMLNGIAVQVSTEIDVTFTLRQ